MSNNGMKDARDWFKENPRIVELTPEILAALNIVLDQAKSITLSEIAVEMFPELFNERDQQVTACEVINTLLGTALDPIQEKYLADQRCPVCGSADAGPLSYADVDGAVARMVVTCNVCGATWEDIYRLVGFTDLEEGSENG